jgi:ATP-dependent DNA ligase
MFGRGDPAFVVFDILVLQGRDLRELPLIERKKVLRRLNPRRSAFVLFADFIEKRGCDFYRLVCARDLEGIVAEWKAAPSSRRRAVLVESRSRTATTARRATAPSCFTVSGDAVRHDLPAV